MTHVGKSSQSLKYSWFSETKPQQLQQGSQREDLQHTVFVLPTLEYVAAVWDLFLSSDINRLEQVQQIGAYVHKINRNRTPGCVTRMVRDLGWQTLEDRRRNL